MAEQYNDDVIILYDEDGNDIRFRFLDELEQNGERYVALCPEDEMDTDAAEVLFFQIQTDKETGDEILAVVESPKLLDKLFVRFKELHQDEFTFRG